MNRPVLLLLLLSSLLPGCAAESASQIRVADWRKGVERYVWEQGNGDPAVLRDVSWDDVHPGFAILGDPLPDRSTDIYGLLLAHPRIEGRAYFVFLVAVIRNEVMEEMLPVALNIDAGTFHWAEGPADEEQMRRYVESRDFEPRTAPPKFPARDDSFNVYADGNTISISHEQSGARWRIELPRDDITASPPTARPAHRSDAAPDPPAPASPYPPPRPGAAPADTSSTRPAGN